MKYNFDEILDRRGTGSLKWDVGENELPMWVADMDFKVAPCIRKAIQSKLDHGIFGYSITPESWAQSYIDWWGGRHGLKISKEDLIFCTGVVPAISSCVRKLTYPAEMVSIQTPVYNIFFNSIVNNGRFVKQSPLRYRDGRYSVDFERLEQDLCDPQVSLMILCNPHNPIGKIWDRETLKKIGHLCKKYGVTVISDEIHCDITEPGKNYLPFAEVDEICKDISVTCIAPTKCFNIAGLNSAAVAVFNPLLRHKVWRALNTDEVAEPNAFAVDVTVAAFEEGGEWVDEMRKYVFDNKKIAAEYIEKDIAGVFAVESDATYLSWLDCHAISSDSSELAGFIRQKTGLYLCEGIEYGESGEGFLRLNCACPRTLLEDGLSRLKNGVNLYIQDKDNNM